MENSEIIQLNFWQEEFKRVRLDLPPETAARLARVHMAMHPDKGARDTGEAALILGLQVLEKRLEGGE
jgi:hypothetical protein